jgi:hypothetical protein
MLHMRSLHLVCPLMQQCSRELALEEQMLVMITVMNMEMKEKRELVLIEVCLLVLIPSLHLHQTLTSI